MSSECTFTGNCEVLTTVRASATERLQRKRLDGASLSPCYMTVMSFTLEGYLTLWDLTLSPQWILTMKGHIIENMKIGFLQLELYFYWISFVPWSPKCRRAWSQGDGFRVQRSSLMLAQTSQGQIQGTHPVFLSCHWPSMVSGVCFAASCFLCSDGCTCWDFLSSSAAILIHHIRPRRNEGHCFFLAIYVVRHVLLWVISCFNALNTTGGKAQTRRQHTAAVSLRGWISWK